MNYFLSPTGPQRAYFTSFTNTSGVDSFTTTCPWVPLDCQGQRYCQNLLSEKALLSPSAVCSWNFTLSIDNASGTHKVSAEIQGVNCQFFFKESRYQSYHNIKDEDFYVLKANTSRDTCRNNCPDINTNIHLFTQQRFVPHLLVC